MGLVANENFPTLEMMACTLTSNIQREETKCQKISYPLC